MQTLTRLLMPLALALIVTAGPALADSSASSPANKAKADPAYAQAEQMVEDGKYEGAIPVLEGIVAKDKENADAFNLLGYSHRQLGNIDIALGHYETALRLQPRHRGANEYLGELYLKLGDLEKAQERLDVLDNACFFGCKEYTELKNAIAAYKAKAGS